MPEMSSDAGAKRQNYASEVTTTGEATDAISQLPESQQAGLPGIEELLNQLETAVAASEELQPEEKTQALEQVKVLAEAGKNPQAESKRTAAAVAIAKLREKIERIPGVPTLVGTWERIAPEITEIFGLEN